jgi:hypothetical protein
MLSIKRWLAFIILPIAIASCDDEKNEDVTVSVNKNGSIETVVHINHLDSSRDELVTTHQVWVKQNLYKSVEYRDTLPNLGVQNTEAENEDGDTKRVEVPKDYEIYITVK